MWFRLHTLTQTKWILYTLWPAILQMLKNSAKGSASPIAVVTGSAGSLGQQVCKRLVSRGFHVIHADVAISPPSEAPQASDADPGILSFQLDVTDPRQWESLREKIEREYSRLDCLVNCAGVLHFGEAEKTRWQADKSMLDVNLYGTILGSKTMLELLRKSRRGHLINIASYAGFAALPWAAAYAASKAGVIAFTESLANELRNDDIYVSVVCPAFFPSGLFEWDAIEDEALAACLARVVERSTLTAEQVADAVVGLLDNPKLQVILPAEARRVWRWKRWFPGWFMRVVKSKSASFRAKMEDRLAERD